MCMGDVVDSVDSDRFILPAYYITDCLDRAGLDYSDYDEVKYKTIIYLSLVAGILILIIVLIFVISSIREINNAKNENNSNKLDRNINDEWIYSIEVLNGKLKGKIFRFDSDIIIGRDPSKCSIIYPIDEPGISGEHCRIYKSGMICCIKDENSAYGTYLGDGTRLSSDKAYVLKNGDIFFLASANNSMKINVEKKGAI